jgi:hypothetical protein
MPRTPHTTKIAHQLAKDAADRYFAALAADIPSDEAPSDLLREALAIHDEIKHAGPKRNPDDQEDSALRAGYLLGVEVGRRMAGGAR